MSNLLASQLRRYVIDLYWDVANRRFSLCPVELPTSSATASSTTGPARQATNATLQSAPDTIPTASQGSNSAFRSTFTTAAVSAATSSVALDTSNGRTLFQIGRYQCSNTLSLQGILSVFRDYTIDTSDTTQAKLSIVVVNLHVAATASNSNSSNRTLETSELPNAEQSVRISFGELDGLLYKPNALFSDRQSLNASWFRRPVIGSSPASTYYSLYTASNGDLATTDGWPDESFVQRVRGKRILVGYGSVDNSLGNYNISGDGDRIFSPGYLVSERGVSLNNDGALSRGCFYNSNTYDHRQVNNSWAVTSINTISPSTLR